MTARPPPPPTVLLLLVPLAAGCFAGGKATVTGNPAGMSFEARAMDPSRAVQTPTAFSAAVVKAELLRGEDDRDPAVIFDGADGDVPYALVDLTDADQEVWSGEVGPRYFGTYTHARVTVAAVGQVITIVDPADAVVDQRFAEFFQAVDNRAGEVDGLPRAEIALGDVMVSVDDAPLEWFQIDEDRAFTRSGVRADVDAYQDPDPGSATQVIPLLGELTIESDHDYVLTATFDLRDTFEYVDRDDDGSFEPFGDDHDGTMNGIGFSVHVPGLSMTAE